MLQDKKTFGKIAAFFCVTACAAACLLSGCSRSGSEQSGSSDEQATCQTSDSSSESEVEVDIEDLS